jgi:predicted kinase
MLIVMAGLPGSGKSTIAEDLGRVLNCAVLGVDQVEAAMWRAGIGRSEPTHEGAYGVVAALAAEQIGLGHDVVIDAVNGPEEARAHWRQLAARLRAELRFIEDSAAMNRYTGPGWPNASARSRVSRNPPGRAACGGAPHSRRGLTTGSPSTR